MAFINNNIMTNKLTTASKTTTKNNNDEKLASFGDLPEELMQHVLSYADVPTLGACAMASKGLSQLTKRDAVWAVHLKALLKKLYDENMDVPYMLSETESPKSTQFLDFLKVLCSEMGKSPSWDTNVDRHFCSWLAALDLDRSEVLSNLFHGLFVADVSSSREYYKLVGSWAVVGYENSRNQLGFCRCPMCPCYYNWDEDGALDDLPAIRLFRPELLARCGGVEKCFRTS
ncbi:expressed unknown protein [Seminavis robusta]|uniref:F-box domain-containing protein n=1 Tax=Seminavis robusta TaxID=568900 RepID=A0A9N8HL79_9STRA|nr:expressed unknown protein [Seminavis robusta]|eukprot:Sro664_g183730.1 n/a (230) ;mRNA; f:46235-46924